MRTLTVATFLSLDNVIQAPGGPSEDTRDDFPFGGWIVPYADEISDRAIQELFAQPFELLLGRRTYDIFAAYWPSVQPGSSHQTIGDKFNRVAKHVATHRPDTLDWHNSHALQGDVVEAVRTLKHQKGAPLLTQGSGDLVRQLLAAGLVDELRLMTFPVLLGRGQRLFGDDAEAAAFRLEQLTSTPSGVLICRYVRAGEVRTGSFAE